MMGKRVGMVVEGNMDGVSQCYVERYQYVAGGHAEDVAERVLLLVWECSVA